ARAARIPLRKGDFVTAASRLVEPFSSSLVPVRALLTSGSPDVGGRGARQLVGVPDLRPLRARDPGLDGGDVLRLCHPAGATDPRPDDPVRIRRLPGPAEPEPLHDQLLPDGDALHRLRHRGRLSLSARRHPPPARLVRLRRVPLLHRRPRGRLRVHLAQGSSGVAVGQKRLAQYGLHSERVMWQGKGPGVFETELGELEEQLGLTTVEKAIAWAQGSSIWPDTFGLACCAIEMMSIVSARYDVARFGAEVFRSSPRQADLLIVSGRVAHKMAAPLRQIYDQMLEPKWVIAMGACASSGGMFNNYTILQGVDRIVPVDIYVPFCPPRPEALMEGIIRLHEAHLAGVPPAYERREVAT